jgi:hypothetical protein
LKLYQYPIQNNVLEIYLQFATPSCEDNGWRVPGIAGTTSLRGLHGVGKRINRSKEREKGDKEKEEMKNKMETSEKEKEEENKKREKTANATDVGLAAKEEQKLEKEKGVRKYDLVSKSFNITDNVPLYRLLTSDEETKAMVCHDIQV